LGIKKHYLIGALVLTLTGVACRGKHNAVAVQNEEDASPRMASTLRMNDPKAAVQLLSGFYPVEGGAWRWTAGKFSVLLRTPPGAAQQGATVTLDFTIPEVVIQKSKDITLTASVNGMMLQSTGYKAAGAQKFTADVPATALHADTVTVDYALDKTLPPGIDKRELGIVATSVGIAGK
jgi:hypothetical protein